MVITPLSKIFQFYGGGEFYWWGNVEYPEKTTDLPVANRWQKLSHNAVWSTPRHERGSNSQL